MRDSRSEHTTEMRVSDPCMSSESIERSKKSTIRKVRMMVILKVKAGLAAGLWASEQSWNAGPLVQKS